MPLYCKYVNMKSTINKQFSYGNYSFRDTIDVSFPLDTIQDDNSDYFACMDEPVTVTQHVTTEMFDEGASDSKVFTQAPRLSSYGPEYESIVDFMRKPMLVQQITWATGNAANAVINSANSMIGGFMVSVPSWKHKLEGFTLCRGTAKLKLVLNATPFQAGMLLLHVIPGNALSATNLTMYNSSLSSKVQQPGVQISCRDTAVELTIPFVNPFDWYNITTSANDWGQWFVTVLSPLAVDASGPQTADITIYLSFEDFELAAPACIQAKLPKISGRKVSKADEEAEAVSSGKPISNTLKTVSIVADAVKDVPFIGEFAGTVSWAADLASGVASFFGFSKPLNNTTSMFTVGQSNRFQITSDGVENAIPLTIRSDNKLKILQDVTGRPEDEMSFEFLKKVEFLALPSTSANTTYSLTWTTSNASGTALNPTRMVIAPGNLYYQSSTTDGAHVSTWNIGGPLYYLSQYFSHWRGSIRLRMKFVKTQFHTGRLQITFTPGLTVNNIPTLSTSVLSLREIVDISICDEIMFELPYLLDSPYATNTPNSAVYQSGNLDVTVLNELRAPDTVAQSIEVLLFWSGGDDFEFNGGSITSNAYYSAYQAHSNISTLMPHVNPECNLGAIGDATRQVNSTIFAEQCFGEKFTSVNQLLSRYYYFYGGVPVATKTGAIYPWFTGILGSNAAGLVGPNIGLDPYSNIGAMYRYFRGSSRVALWNNGGTDFIQAVLVNLGNVTMTTPFTSLSLGTTGSFNTGPVLNNSAIYSSNNDSYYVFNVPYTNNLRMSYVIPDSAGTAWQDTTASKAVLWVSTKTNNLSTFSYARSFGDDFQLSYFIACPPVMVGHT